MVTDICGTGKWAGEKGDLGRMVTGKEPFGMCGGKFSGSLAIG